MEEDDGEECENVGSKPGNSDLRSERRAEGAHAMGHNPSLQLIDDLRGAGRRQAASIATLRSSHSSPTRSTFKVLYCFHCTPLLHFPSILISLPTKNMSNVPTSPSAEISSTSLKRTKIVLLGDQSVGKTSLITRYVQLHCFSCAS